MIPLTAICVILREVAVDGEETAVSLLWDGSFDINYNDSYPPKLGDSTIQADLVNTYIELRV